jgi:hypothetical protein
MVKAPKAGKKGVFSDPKKEILKTPVWMIKNSLLDD